METFNKQELGNKFWEISFPTEEEEVEYMRRRELYRTVPSDNKYMQIAKEAAILYSKTVDFPIGIIAVKNGEVIAQAGNGNGYHQENSNKPGHRDGCVRKFLRDQTKARGEVVQKGFLHDLCPGCHTDSHAEANLINDTENKDELKEADVYMFGHFWCCKSCWQKMKNAGVKDVYLPENNEIFNTKEGVADWVLELKNERSKRGIS